MTCAGKSKVKACHIGLYDTGMPNYRCCKQFSVQARNYFCLNRKNNLNCVATVNRAAVPVTESHAEQRPQRRGGPAPVGADRRRGGSRRPARPTAMATKDKGQGWQQD